MTGLEILAVSAPLLLLVVGGIIVYVTRSDDGRRDEHGRRHVH